MSDKPEDGTPALRRMLLSAKASDFGLTPTTELPRVWAAMMEMRLGKADVSLVAVAEGSTSLYFSTGGGIIGGGEHDSVRAANHKWLVAIDRFFPAFVARDAPLEVVAGAVSFAVLMYDGLRVARDTEERLIQKKSPLWPVRYLGEEIITALRLTTEKPPG
jgi:hypothetical protein